MILQCNCVIVIVMECNLGRALVSCAYEINLRLIICELRFISIS